MRYNFRFDRIIIIKNIIILSALSCLFINFVRFRLTTVHFNVKTQLRFDAFSPFEPFHLPKTNQKCTSLLKKHLYNSSVAG